MNAKVVSLFERLQTDFAQLLALLDKEKIEYLEKSPAAGKWSVTQVMYHLNKAESNSVLYVSKKRLGAASLKPTGLNASLRLLFARISFYFPFKYRAPKLLGEMPEHVGYEEVKKSWMDTRVKLQALLASLPEDELKKPVFRQPFFGRWNIFQMLGFMQTHFNRHQKQIFRTLKLVLESKN